MCKWEYSIFEWSDNIHDNIDNLQSAGNAGWELVQIKDNSVILKRKSEYSHAPKKAEIGKDEAFNECWIKYRRKGSKKKSLEQWNRLSIEEKQKVKQHIKAYVDSVSDIKYQKDFERYLRDKCFLNVVYKDGKTLFDIEEEKKTYETDNRLIINGIEYK